MSIAVQPPLIAQVGFEYRALPSNGAHIDASFVDRNRRHGALILPCTTLDENQRVLLLGKNNKICCVFFFF